LSRRSWWAGTPAAVSEAAAKYGWQETATDWRSVLDRDDIHIVDICAPGWMHAEIAIAALEAGKHVLLEKPLANTLAEAEAITAAARAARAKGVQSMVGFNYRRVPALALTKELVSEGRLGAVRQVRAAYLQGLAGRRGRTDDVAVEEGDRRLGGVG
jgi:predicted dehydrogenase